VATATSAPSVAAGASVAPGVGSAAVTLADLAAHEGQMAVVGGMVTRVDGVRLTIDDGSASAVVRLVGQASALITVVAIGDLLNARGMVERNAAGGLEVAVEDPSAVELLSAQVTLNTRAPSPWALSSGDAIPTGEGASTTSSGHAPLVALAIIALAIGLLSAAFLATPANRKRFRQVLIAASESAKRRLAQARSS